MTYSLLKQTSSEQAALLNGSPVAQCRTLNWYSWLLGVTWAESISLSSVCRTPLKAGGTWEEQQRSKYTRSAQNRLAPFIHNTLLPLPSLPPLSSLCYVSPQTVSTSTQHKWYYCVTSRPFHPMTCREYRVNPGLALYRYCVDTAGTEPGTLFYLLFFSGDTFLQTFIQGQETFCGESEHPNHCSVLSPSPTSSLSLLGPWSSPPANTVVLFTVDVPFNHPARRSSKVTYSDSAIACWAGPVEARMPGQATPGPALYLSCRLTVTDHSMGYSGLTLLGT